jgi:hypothetical protein
MAAGGGIHLADPRGIGCSAAGHCGARTGSIVLHHGVAAAAVRLLHARIGRADRRVGAGVVGRRHAAAVVGVDGRPGAGACASGGVGFRGRLLHARVGRADRRVRAAIVVGSRVAVGRGGGTGGAAVDRSAAGRLLHTRIGRADRRIRARLMAEPLLHCRHFGAACPSGAGVPAASMRLVPIPNASAVLRLMNFSPLFAASLALRGIRASTLALQGKQPGSEFVSKRSLTNVPLLGPMEQVTVRVAALWFRHCWRPETDNGFIDTRGFSHDPKGEIFS